MFFFKSKMRTQCHSTSTISFCASQLTLDMLYRYVTLAVLATFAGAAYGHDNAYISLIPQLYGSCGATAGANTVSFRDVSDSSSSPLIVPAASRLTITDVNIFVQADPKYSGDTVVVRFGANPLAGETNIVEQLVEIVTIDSAGVGSKATSLGTGFALHAGSQLCATWAVYAPSGAPAANVQPAIHAFGSITADN